MSQSEEVLKLCEKVFENLRTNDSRLVLAESCSAGLIAAELGHIPGVSEVLAGSFVAYQVDSKIGWLGLEKSMIDRFGVVSREVAEEMAKGALRMTPHAGISLSVTGHVGPNAPKEQDGVVWSAIADEHGIESRQFQMGLKYGANASASETVSGLTARDVRIARQYEVVKSCLEFLLSRLKGRTVH